MNFSCDRFLSIPTITQKTAAFLVALLDQLNELCANRMLIPSESTNGHNVGACLPITIEFVATKAAEASVCPQ